MNNVSNTRYIIGDRGPQGIPYNLNPGPRGNRGPIGYQGHQGFQGYQGLQGQTGMILLSKQTLVGSTGTVIFSSISQDYTHLRIIVHAQLGTPGSVGLLLSINAPSIITTNTLIITSTSTTLSMISVLLDPNVRAGPVGTIACCTDIFIPCYKQTNYNKTCMSTTTVNNITRFAAASFETTSAITQINLSVSTNSLGVGSTFSLYGLF
jgi:hypothetical protein